MFQCFGHFHVMAILPEWAVLTMRSVIMENNEVPNFNNLIKCLTIIFLGNTFADSTIREEFLKANDAHYDQMNAGGLQRLYKTTRQSKR